MGLLPSFKVSVAMRSDAFVSAGSETFSLANLNDVLALKLAPLCWATFSAADLPPPLIAFWLLGTAPGQSIWFIVANGAGWQLFVLTKSRPFHLPTLSARQRKSTISS